MLKSSPAVWLKWLFAAIVFIASWCFLFWKCRFGFGNIDEAFYLTIPYRLCQGDSLLVNEWHLSQTSGFLLLPAMRLHMLIFGSTEGIILHFRYLYTAVWGVSAAFFFYRLKSYTFWGAAIASLMFMIYAPFGIMALSYNSMGILFLLNTIIIAFTAKKHLRVQYVFAGISFAGAVLCCPYLAAVYVLFAVTALIAIRLCKGENRRIIKEFLIWTTVGCALLAAIFAVYVLSHAPLSDIIKAFPTMMQDPEHPPMTLLTKFIIYISAILHSAPHLKWMAISTILLIICGMRFKRLRGIFLIGICCVALWYLYPLAFQKRYLNYVMLPLTLIGIYCGFTTNSKQIRGLFIGVLTGLLYTFCIHMASNQAFFAISSAATVSSVISAVMLPMYITEITQEPENKIPKICTVLPSVLLILCLLGSETLLRYNSIFWESSKISDENILLEKGPEKGIFSNTARTDEYQRQYEKARPIFEGQYGKNVLFLSDITWYYLCGNIRSCAYSSWLSGVTEDTVQRLVTYYEICSEKLPDVIFLEDIAIPYIETFFPLGYTVSTLDNGSVILLQNAT